MASILSAGTTSATALNMSADTSGVLQLASNNGTVAVTVDTAQNVGIGTATTNPVGSGRNLAVNSGSGTSSWSLSSAGTLGMYAYTDGTNGTFSVYPSGYMAFNTANTERARIDSSGNLLVGTSGYTQTPSQGFVFQNTSNSNLSIGHANGTGSGNGYMIFAYNGGLIGSITQNGTTSTSYNTSSDYRLKENIQPMAGALAKVAALKPVTYTWKADGSAGEGFIAHELQEVCPQAVTGEKDAVDAEGNPQYQGIDVSFLVGTLTAALQEAHGLIKNLETRLAALEGAK